MRTYKKSKYDGEFMDIVLNNLGNMNRTQAVKFACKKLGVEYNDNVRNLIGKLLKNRNLAKPGNNDAPDIFKKAQQREFDKGKQTFIISWAQNNTPVHEGFFKNMVAYADYRNANLHIIAGRYKNPTSIWNMNNSSEEFWVEEVVPYLDANRHNVHKFLQVLSDIKVTPTASTPLSSMNGVTGMESCIIGHPRQHLKSLPVLEGYPNKLLLSTGSCTRENYTDSKAGKKGEFHHVYGFVIVELDGDYFHVRHVSADENGDFYDLLHRVKGGEVSYNHGGCIAAILGDIHVRNSDKEAVRATFDILNQMGPSHVLIHDIADFESINPHEEKDPFQMLQKEETYRDILEDEIKEVVDWIDMYKDYNLVLVRSNHDDFLDRWLKNSDWRKVGNKKSYLKYAGVLASSKLAQEKGVLAHIVNEKFGDVVKVLGLNDSYRVKGWELAMHGHLGSSGTRGSHIQFKNMNTKNVTGHCHHPHREDGHVSVGTLTNLRLSYNNGASNWMNSNALIYPDGKLQIINFVNGKFCR